MQKSRVWGLIRSYIMIAPATLAICVFVIYPSIYLIYLSFHKYNLLNRAKSKFIGWDNYVTLFGRETFYKSLLNTVLYTAGVVVFTILISLLVALWINENKKLNSLVQISIFTPHIVSIVSIAMVWMWLMDPTMGLLNYVLELFGLPPSKWLQSSKTALMSVILVSIWHSIGYYSLIIVAAIKGVSVSLYEAAKLDGASKFRMFYNITIPMISPQLFFILIIMTIGSFKVFDTVNIMTGGGPNYATNTLVYYIFQFRSENLGLSAATGVVLMAIVGLLTIVYFRILSKKVHYQ